MRRPDLRLVAMLLGLMIWSHAAAADGPRVFDLQIVGGKIAGGTAATVSVTHGETVKLRVSSDKPLSVHVHGYDVEKTVEPGTVTEMSVHCFAPGRFPVTVHLHADDHDHDHGKSKGGADGEALLLYLNVNQQ